MKETWKRIRGFEDYEISDLGRINSFKTGKERFLKLIKDNRGYYVIHLRRDNKTFQKLVHILVAETFIENPDNHKMVNHKDLDKLNNKKDNLEWCDNRHNVSHYYKSVKTSSKYTGVSVAGNSFRAQIVAEGKRYCLGSYKEEIEASKVYCNALKIYKKEGLDALIMYQKQIKL